MFILQALAVVLIIAIVICLAALSVISLTERKGWFQRTFFPAFTDPTPRTLTPRQQRKFDRADAVYRRQCDRFDAALAAEKARTRSNRLSRS